MDPQQIAKELRLAKKTFNVITCALIEQLLCLFKDNGTLRFLKDELERFAKDPKNNHVPAVKYFKTMNLATTVAPKVDRDAGSIVVGELVIRKDPVIFTDAVGVVIPELEALGIILWGPLPFSHTLKPLPGMKEKWPRLNKTNQEMVWDYLIRMAKTSAQVVIGMQMTDGRLPAVMEDLAKKGVAAHPGMTEEQFARFAEEVRNACVPPSK